MTARPGIIHKTVVSIFRGHIAEMRSYATELEASLGPESNIVKRIRSCAQSNEDALNRLTKCGACGRPNDPAA